MTSQHYAAYVSAAFARFEPSFGSASKSLLVGQPDDYKTHEPWLTDQPPEDVRLSMLETRRQSKLKLADVQKLLASAKGRLHRKPTPKQAILFLNQ